MHQPVMSWGNACGLWCACIGLWCHRPTHGLIAWPLLFWFCLGCTFTPATLNFVGNFNFPIKLRCSMKRGNFWNAWLVLFYLLLLGGCHIWVHVSFSTLCMILNCLMCINKLKIKFLKSQSVFLRKIKKVLSINKMSNFDELKWII